MKLTFASHEEAAQFVKRNPEQCADMSFIAELKYYDDAEFVPVKDIQEAKDEYWDLGEKLYMATGIVRSLDGFVVSDFHDPYEPLTIDIQDPNALQELAKNYSISAEEMRRLCKAYLETVKA